MNWLDLLTKDNIENGSFPLKEILGNSLFYPACGDDGSPIRNWQLDVNSFIYVDYFFSEKDLVNAIENRPFRGYHLLGQRNITKSELIPHGWSPQIPSGLETEFHKRYIDAVQRSGVNFENLFSKWMVFERDPELNETHGPKRFSLLFIRGEGAASYQALYITNRVLPKVIALVRPGEGFGGNYNDFSQVLLQTILMHEDGLPSNLLAWHPNDKSQLNEDSLWSDYYDKNPISEAFSKDHDHHFKMSLYPRLT
jgi:hypothetical protein